MRSSSTARRGQPSRALLGPLLLALWAGASSPAGSALSRAHEALAAGRHDAAASMLRSLLAAEPQSAEAHGALGVALASMGEEYADEADAAFEASIALQPHVARHHVNRGLARQAAGDPLHALECFQAALEAEPAHGGALMHMGDVLAELGHVEGAAAMLQRAVQVAPESGGAWNRLGKFLHELGEYEEAQHALKAACAVSPEDTTARHNLGIALRATGLFEEARAAFEAEASLGGETDQSLAYLTIRVGNETMQSWPSEVACADRVTRVVSDAVQDTAVACVPLDALPPLSGDWQRRLSVVHVTPVASTMECRMLINVCEEHASAHGGWDQAGHHDAHPTRDLVVASVPYVLSWLNQRLNSTILPALAHQFGVDPSDLWLTDAFVVKYAADGQPGLAHHVDDSEISFNILLSDEATFEGGGTHFDALGSAITPAQGEMVSHCGLLRHAGREVTAGARYILAGFVRARPLAAEWRSVRRFLKEEHDARLLREEDEGVPPAP